MAKLVSTVNEWAWGQIAKVVSHPKVFDYLYSISRPYFDLLDDNGEVYMHRRWLFNPTPPFPVFSKETHWSWAPSIRIHWIRRPDSARDPHDHPWPARTIVCRRWYIETRDGRKYFRGKGDTATLKPGEFHHIEDVPPEGVWTIFITWKWEKVWGFSTALGFIPWRTYLGKGPNEDG